MYEIRADNILSFLNDKTVRFPRFQRKQTWNETKNMELAVSVFKQYPIGVTIINKEDYKGQNTRWLLDGRQRRHALKLILENPENIYKWSKRFLKIKGNSQLQDIEEEFWKKIDDYLNQDIDDENQEDKLQQVAQIEYQGDFDDDTDNEEKLDSLDNDLLVDEISSRSYLGNLVHLLEIIKTVHPLRKSNSGFSKPFDFTVLTERLPYIEKEDGNVVISGKKLTTFIQEYLKYARDDQLNQYSKDSFKDFLTLRVAIPNDKEKKLDQILEKNWEGILRSIRAVESIENTLSESRIGIIETDNISATDSQMIFKLINDAGTKLSAVEILSAKPTWNIKVKNPNETLIKHTKQLYTVIGVESSADSPVRWDYPATFYERLQNLEFIFPNLSYEKKLENKLTLGFKLLSGIYEKGIKKEDISNLSKSPIAWETDIDKLEIELSNIGKILKDNAYFSFLHSYNQSLLSLTSEAIALNFIFIIYLDYQRKGAPVASKTKALQKNAYILVDRLIYEYLTKRWRGSSDSRVAQNIKQFQNQLDIFDPVKENDWKDLIIEINEKFTIQDEDIKFSLMKPLVFHIYSTCGIDGPNNPKINVEVDHILPKNIINNSVLSSENFLDSLFNLAPFPEKENIKKSDDALDVIKDKWLITQITKYTGIEKEDFEKYSDASNWKDLRELRSKFLLDQFLSDRRTILNN